jgi:peptide/nickel transport system ATP-binding protein
MKSVLEVKKINKAYISRRDKVKAVKDVSFKIYEGECLALIGESGCGKSTIAKLITRLDVVDAGEILLNGKDITYIEGKALREIYEEVQMVFQTPVESFNPRFKLGDGIMESMINQGSSRLEAKKRVNECLKMCGLTEEFADKYPHQVSGGECQRASIARAIAIKPKLLICDEITSALDVTIQAQILKLIEKLKNEMSMACLLISHDIALVQEICDRVIVMNQGKLIEEGTPKEIIMNPQQEYTKKMIEAVFEVSL